MSNPDLSWIPARYIYAVSGVLVTVLFSMIAFGIKRLIAGVQSEWKTATARLEVIETTTRTQAENHLMTIQTESVKQTGLLESLNEKQAENNGKFSILVDILSKRA